MAPTWLAYVPLPGLAYIPSLMAPGDRFVRYHARQGAWLVGLLWIGLVLVSLLGQLSQATWFQYTIGFLLMVWLLAGLAGCGAGVVWSVRGVYGRVRPVWDLLAALGR